MFTTTPEQYGSLYENQVFKFNSTFIEDHTYVIKEVNSSEIIGVKKFYQTNSAEVNVAPIARPYATPKPSSFTTGFQECQNFGAVKVSLTKSGSVEEQQVHSEEVVLTLSHREESDAAILTTLTETRSLSMGENELILIRCQPHAMVCVTVKQHCYKSIDQVIDEQADTTVQYNQVDSGDGIVLFSLCGEKLGNLTEEQDAEIEKITIEVTESTEQGSSETTGTNASSMIGNVTYYIIDPPRRSMRLAWVSSRGSVEHYTMPFITSELMTQDGSRAYTLSSALESYKMREAIAEVVNSPVIWVVDSGKYIEVEVVDKEIELSPREDLATVKFKISFRD